MSTRTQETVTGEVKLKLYKGNIINAGMTSPYSLYSEEIATFGEDHVYDQNGLPRLHQSVWPAHRRAGNASEGKAVSHVHRIR